MEKVINYLEYRVDELNKTIRYYKKHGYYPAARKSVIERNEFRKSISILNGETVKLVKTCPSGETFPKNGCSSCNKAHSCDSFQGQVE